MQAWITLLGTLTCSGLVAFTVTSTHPQLRASEPDDSIRLDERKAALSALAGEVDELREQLADLLSRAEIARPERVVRSDSQLDLNELQDAVRGLVREEALAAGDATEAPLWPGETESATAAFEAILAAGIRTSDGVALWEEAAENGQLHELLAAMEEHLEALPESADKHVQRAESYYSAARALPGNQVGNWWVDSDDAYTRALELDGAHWQARFSKARNMSFWPSAYGGQAEAVRHFEVLVDQQEGLPKQAKFADTYLWLGNLYDQQGKSDQALATWERGFAQHPSHSGLDKKLNSLGL